MPPKPELSALAASRLILEQAAAPLHYEEITTRILASGIWHTSGKTPAATLSALLSNQRQETRHRFPVYPPFPRPLCP